MKFYTIAVQRWPFPWARKFRAVDHFWTDDEKKLTIVDVKGTAHCIPRMDRRIMKVYADIKTFKQSLLPAVASIDEDALTLRLHAEMQANGHDVTHEEVLQ